jgi:hypothetical protein
MVFSISSGVASIRESVLPPYGVIKYEESAESRPPSIRGVGAVGLRTAIGMGVTPPKKSSIWSMRGGRREYKKRVWNMSKTYVKVSVLIKIARCKVVIQAPSILLDDSNAHSKY